MNFKSTNEGPKVQGTLVVGNVLDTLGSYGAYTPGSQLAVEGPTDVYLQDLAVNYDASLAGQGFSAQIGRVHTKVGHYLFRGASTPASTSTTTPARTATTTSTAAS